MARAWVLAGLLWAAPALAQEEPQPTPTEQPLKITSDYYGVAPGSPGATQKKYEKPTLTWVGFQATDGGARVFAQSNTSPQVEQTVSGNELIVSLGELALGERNNLRPLDCRFFATDVARVWIKRRGKQTYLHVRMRDKVAPRKATQQIVSEGGMWLVLLDL